MCIWLWLFTRNEDITNFVAFPNKYSDYINARLQVVVKNSSIGYYPLKKERQSLIQNVKEPLEKIEKKDENLYESYIEDLSYTNMVKDLVKYHKQLVQKENTWKEKNS